MRIFAAGKYLQSAMASLLVGLVLILSPKISHFADIIEVPRKIMSHQKKNAKGVVGTRSRNPVDRLGPADTVDTSLMAVGHHGMRGPSPLRNIEFPYTDRAVVAARSQTCAVSVERNTPHG